MMRLVAGAVLAAARRTITVEFYDAEH